MHETVQNPKARVSSCSAQVEICKEGSGLHTKRSEEPAVLARCVAFLQCLLDSLLGILSLRNLLECIGSNGTLQSFQFQSVTCWHQMVIVDDLDERLDFGALGLSGLGHAAGDLRWIALDTSDDCVRVWMRFVAGILWLNNNNLFCHISAVRF